MSPTFSPALASSFGTAKTGPIPISAGSQPATANPRNTPSGFSPLSAAVFPFITMHTPAPSENWLALPAEITPPSIAGLIFETDS
jgi:hypothetical protein